MTRERWTLLPFGLAVLGILISGMSAAGRDTEKQLLRQIQIEQNPVKKAKDEIKLGSLKLAQIKDAYSHGQVDAGQKLLPSFLDTMKTSWKTLQDSGRNAAKQPGGFRELEIALREDVRTLHDLGRTVSYYDRQPLENAAQELETIHGEVIHALFPGAPPRTLKGAAPPPAGTSPENPPPPR
jgi:hypothetical protein